MQATVKSSGLSARGRIVGYKCSQLSALGRCVILILLSVCWTTEARQCYWCGPLSEQVHRSRRVLPCSSQLTTTDCDPGYDHCAVIASAPKYVESRLCVKLYQDECYHTFCNTTKVWRMTCPCRGDLCNGPNTERENEAFDILKRLVYKTKSQIIKRSSKIDTEELMLNIGNNDITATNNNNDNVDTPSENLPIMNKEDTSQMEKITNDTSSKENESIVIEITTQKINVIKKEVKLDEMQSDQPNPGHDDGAVKLKVPQMETNNLEKGPENNKESKPDVKANLDSQMLHDTKEQATHAEVTTTTKMSSVQVSTEATKTTQLTPAGDTNSTKGQTGTAKPKENNAVGIYLHTILLVKWLIMYYYL